jgi:hypothetical protein
MFWKFWYQNYFHNDHLEVLQNIDLGVSQLSNESVTGMKAKALHLSQVSEGMLKS